MAGLSGRSHRIFSSDDAGATWLDAGAAPPGLTDLAPTGSGGGFAASSTGHGPKLWSVTAEGARIVPLELPAWVATIGSRMTDS